MKKIISFFLLFALPLVANGYDFSVENSDGVIIYYNYINDGTELEVTSKGSGSYSKAVNIPEEVTYMSGTRKVTSIGSEAFIYCFGLTSITIPNTVNSIGNNAFSNCRGLVSVTIPNSVTNIGDFAFYNCRGLTSLSIPNSVKNIGTSAFENCISLTSVTIPMNVTKIGRFAFQTCTSLTSVISKMENPCSISSDCFHNNVFYNVKLYVPKGSIDKYKTMNYWSKFVFIEELGSDM